LAEAEAREARGGNLKWIKVRQGQKIRLIPVEEVCYFKAADKYTVVRTRKGESLIKTSISHLVENLDPELFWRIHRSTIVNIVRTATVNRSFAGRMDITLKDVPEKLKVSKTYAPLFRQM
jgi:DNA-binding LytR/AlgR family response regulator